jgi:predicted Ser/Thr protein kinase
MKTLKVGTKTIVYRDHDCVIKVGPKDNITWEATILNRLKGVENIPRVLGVTHPIGGGRDTLVLVMTEVPGRPMFGKMDRDLFIKIANLVKEINEAGVAHLRLTPDHILCDGENVGLVGFSGAAIMESYVPTHSPDVCGFIDNTKVSLRSPGIPAVMGSLQGISITQLVEEERE